MARKPVRERPPLLYLDACQRDLWHLRVWRKDSPEDQKIVPFRCRSWRHAGECRRWRGAQDFARIEEAIKKRDDWTYMVFTYDPKGWRNKGAMYRGGVRLWNKFRCRFAREFGPYQYIQTWEQHRSGRPHVNVLIGNGNFASAAGYDWRSLRRSWVRPAAMASGFGKVVWVEPLRDVSAMAGYLVKLADELVGADRKGQTPVSAPRHFRRIRSSQGLLPRPWKDDELSGTLCQCRPEDFYNGVNLLNLQEQLGTL